MECVGSSAVTARSQCQHNPPLSRQARTRRRVAPRGSISALISSGTSFLPASVSNTGG